ncbi:hypothetical protein A3D78_03065 [Candidatus Gottesmanbacteria bacterium RIFCSPHIGHO2_02_FULL_39_14]|uniref:Uncharacterized protein n=1 Tax=Candidatus Gottesmanbacteria bacterium RIFCSPHIGHO2_02_FULL_39_14 TaxID=1798383 RepID=A0A1F6A384_9BACT|nr:MAG: hypothetical protein A3D78_03065 [Candidatus Gottesmanbacteria bacterium RIFCSPHIGHO2_02_FULL_39_14]
MIKTLKYSLILIFGFCLLNLRPSLAGAQDMSSESYQLQGGNFNITSESGTSSPARLIDQIGQTSAQIFSAKGILLQSGFLNKASGSSLNFTVNPVIVNFDPLTAGEAVYKDIFIVVENGDFPGYSVLLSQNQPLTSQTGEQIPDTVCDALKNKPCSVYKSNLWQEKLSYGLGYHVKSQNTPREFNKEYFFRPFSSLSKKELPVVFMQSVEKKIKNSAVVTLKLHLSPQQAISIYQNELIFTAIPGI